MKAASHPKRSDVEMDKYKIQLSVHCQIAKRWSSRVGPSSYQLKETCYSVFCSPLTILLVFGAVTDPPERVPLKSSCSAGLSCHLHIGLYRYRQPTGQHLPACTYGNLSTASEVPNKEAEIKFSRNSTEKQAQLECLLSVGSVI